VRLVMLVCVAASYVRAQAAAEYGGAVATAGARVAATQPLTTASGTFSQEKPSSVHLIARRAEDPEAANRKALEARAGKDAAKLMLRSQPDKALVRIDGKPVGRTPLLLVLAPGVYKVEMEGLSSELAHQQVQVLPHGSREVLLALEARYPGHVTLSWPRTTSR
jgi:PEGA domain